MSSQQLSPLPDTTLSATPAPLSQALSQLQHAENRLAERIRVISKAFLIVISVFCLALLVKWVWAGHYLGGPILAGVIFCLMGFLYRPVSLLWRPQQWAVDKAWRQADEVRREAGKAFMASQDLGAYHWITRGGRMLGVFPDSRTLYLLAAESGEQHALMDAPRVVKAVRVDEQAVTSTTSNTTTKHGRRHVFGFTNSWGMIGSGKSRSTTTTTSSTVRTFTLHVQLQCEGHPPFWVQMPFADNWQEAQNWKLLIEQTLGR
jgi:hypothetical protein